MKAPLHLLLALAPLASCHFHFDGTSSWTVDGVRLHEKHTETIEILNWDQTGLALDIAAGDVTVTSTQGPSEIEATLHEVTPGDASIEYQDGKLTWVTKSGEPAAIGSVSIRTSVELAGLVVQTGAGDIDVDGIHVANRLSLSTGAGDITVRAGGSPKESRFSTGMGDIELTDFSCPALEASSGMGDVTLRDVTADKADLSTGMGDVEAIDSSFGFLDASTGMGDIDASTASYDEADLDTGMGDVERPRKGL